MPDLTREAIVESAKHAAKKHDGPLFKNKFIQLTGNSDYHIYCLFPESGWSAIRKLAGLVRHPKDKDPLTNDELLEEYHRVVNSRNASEVGSVCIDGKSFSERPDKTVWK